MAADWIVIVTTFTLGLRHGLDWDHIAAVTDITGVEPDSKRALVGTTLYALGHALVVLALGGLALWFGLSLPAWVDQSMEVVVGITLIGLSAWLVFCLLREGDGFVMRSRVTALAELVQTMRGKWGHTATTTSDLSNTNTRASCHSGKLVSSNFAACLAIGATHGIGAETPTQVVTLVAVGAARDLPGALMLLSFVAGMFVSNMAIAFVSTAGYKRANERIAFRRGLGMATALASFVVGLFFICRCADLLPHVAGT